MKKSFYLAILMAFSAFSAQAQIEVKSNGKVSIEAVNSSSSTLQVGSYSDNTAGATIGNVGYSSSLKVSRTSSSDTTSVGICVDAQNSSLYNVGIKAYASSPANVDKTTPNIALKGEATGSKYAIGVHGQSVQTAADSSRFYSSSGIYGTSVYQYNPSFGYTGRYAGYFNGKVRVAGGSLYANVLSPSIYYGTGGSTQNNGATFLSEGRGECVTEKLSQVRAIQFMRDKRDMSEATDEIPAEERERMVAEGIDVDAIEKASRNTESSLSAIQYGLAADQLKEVYPELVYEDKEGNVSINYIEMIPLLVQSINELSSELAELKGTSNKKSKAKTQTTAIEDAADDMDQVRMDQNKPNPFSGSTVITLSVPKKAKQAAIYIYDLSGKQVESVPVEERGKTNITFYASNLSAGMYIYSLVVDGQVKVTRRMMVSEK